MGMQTSTGVASTWFALACLIMKIQNDFSSAPSSTRTKLRSSCAKIKGKRTRASSLAPKNKLISQSLARLRAKLRKAWIEIAVAHELKVRVQSYSTASNSVLVAGQILAANSFPPHKLSLSLWLAVPCLLLPLSLCVYAQFGTTSFSSSTPELCRPAPRRSLSIGRTVHVRRCFHAKTLARWEK